jgi:MEMO1 family protein
MNAKKFTNIRPPAAAGRFYPRDATELREAVNQFLKQTPPAPSTGAKAIIAPHAGYVFSGPIAGSAYAQLLPDRDRISRIVLLGPAHFVPVYGLAASSADAFATPLGLVPLDREALKSLERFPQVQVFDTAHGQEHSLEVHLPFLQTILGEFTLVPLLVGECEPESASEVLEALWGGEETRFVISSDLSHYHNSETARKLDAATAEAIEKLAGENLGGTQACGCNPIRGLLLSARDHGLRGRIVDLRNSGDTAGPRDRVVGYGAFAFATSE